jgi:hypothetical protein
MHQQISALVHYLNANITVYILIRLHAHPTVVIYLILKTTYINVLISALSMPNLSIKLNSVSQAANSFNM